MSPRLPCLPLLALPAVALLPAVCGAQALAPVSWRLSVERGAGAEQCAAEGSINEAVTARLGHTAFLEGSPRVVALTLRREGRRWTGTLEARDERGTAVASRSVDAEGDSCEPLTRALVLSLALLLDPAGALSALPEPAPPPRAASASSATPVEPSPRPPPPPPPPVLLQGAVSAAFALGLGLLPTAAPGMQVAAELRAGALWTAELLVFPSRNSANYPGTVGSWSAGLLAGYGWSLPAGFHVAATGGLRGGVLYGSVGLPSEPLTQGEFGFLSLALRPRLRWRWRALSLELGVEGEVLLLRPRFLLTTGGARPVVRTWHEPWPATLTPFVALGFAFP